MAVAFHFLKGCIQANFQCLFFEAEIGRIEPVLCADRKVQTRKFACVSFFLKNTPSIFIGRFIGLHTSVVSHALHCALIHLWFHRLQNVKIPGCCRENCRSRKLFRVIERIDAGAPAAHGQSGNEVVLPLGGGGEPVVNHRHQLIQQEIIHVESHAEFRPIGIVGIQRVGHDHNQVLFHGIQLNVCFVDPAGVVVVGTVEQPQDLVLFPAFIERSGFHVVGAIWQQNGNRCANA